MIYFNPKPNYERLSRHIILELPPNEMYLKYPEGVLISIDWWQTKEQVHFIEGRFKSITERYGLSEYNDDLLLLILAKYIEVDAVINQTKEDYNQKLRAKQLANLLLLFNTTSEEKYYKLTAANHTETTKISDPKLIHWLGKTIIENVEKGKYPLTLLGFQAEILFMDKVDRVRAINTDKLRAAAEMKVKAPDKLLNQHIADFCLFLYKYLTVETPIKPNPNAFFSDALLNFYFDILELLYFVNRIKIDSEPKDYMRSLLWYRFKQLNPSLSGK